MNRANTERVMGAGRRVTGEDVRRLCRDISDTRVAAIVGTGASLTQLEEAVAWTEGEGDVMGEERRPLGGVVAEIYEILKEADSAWEEEGSGIP